MRLCVIYSCYRQKFWGQSHTVVDISSHFISLMFNIWKRDYMVCRCQFELFVCRFTSSSSIGKHSSYSALSLSQPMIQLSHLGFLQHSNMMDMIRLCILCCNLFSMYLICELFPFPLFCFFLNYVHIIASFQLPCYLPMFETVSHKLLSPSLL